MSQAVVYLARGHGGGAAAAAAFFESYAAQPAGFPHELIVITKGWDGVIGREKLDQLANKHYGRVIDLPDDGFDLGAYMRVCDRIDHEWVCFLNTHSRIQSDGWLGKLRRAAELPGVGAAGATGSWSSQIPRLRNLPGDVLDYAKWKGPMRAVALVPFVTGYHFPRRLLTHFRDFRLFPNPYLRSNSILLRRELFRKFTAHGNVPRTKHEAGIWEAGRSSLTGFLIENSMRPVVVAGNGSVFDICDWQRSYTFWSGEQQNLMVADNRTATYTEATLHGRRMLQRYAWGHVETRSE